MKNNNLVNTSCTIIHMYGGGGGSGSGSTSASLLLLLLLLLLLQAPEVRSQPANRTGGLAQHGVPSMVIIIVVLIAAFFLMAFFSVYLRLCAGDIRSGRSTLRRSLTRARRALRRGLDPAVIDLLPTFEYSAVKGLKLGPESLECAVCLNEFEDDETLRLLPKCSHVFHPDCIGSWLVSHTTCPVCRSDLVAADPVTDVPPSETPHPVPEDETGDEVPLHHISLDVCDEDPSQDEPRPERSDPIQTRPIRSKSTRQPLKFPRSHTTGHSLVPPGENVDRFTLRLPEHVRREIVDGKLDRSASYSAFRTEGRSASSGRGRFQWRFDRAAKSDRWAFLTAPGFFARTASVRSQKRGDGEQTPNQKGVSPSVKTPFDCLGGKAEAAPEPAPVFTVSTQ